MEYVKIIFFSNFLILGGTHEFAKDFRFFLSLKRKHEKKNKKI